MKIRCLVIVTLLATLTACSSVPEELPASGSTPSSIHTETALPTKIQEITSTPIALTPTSTSTPFIQLSCPESFSGKAPIPPFLDESVIYWPKEDEEFLIFRQKTMEVNQENAILSFLNQYGMPPVIEAYRNLQEKSSWVNFLFFQDITNDGIPELIIAKNAVFAHFFYIFGCVHGGYKTFISEDVGGMGGPKILSIKDVNNDGVVEVTALLQSYSQGGHSYQVLRWDGTNIMYIIYNPTSIYPNSGIFVNAGGKIFYDDVNGDSIDELVAFQGIPIWSGYDDYIPWRNQWDYYRWDGQYYTLYDQKFDPPLYRFQAVQDADRYFSSGDLEKARKLYQEVIDNFDLQWFSPERREYLRGLQYSSYSHKILTPPSMDQEEYFNLSAYARFRLMLLEILQGQTKQAAIIYEQIERLYQEGQPGAPYAEMAAAFWDEFVNSNSATSACKKAISFTLSHKDEILTSLGSGFHGLQNRIYEPKDICVIPEIH